MAIKADHSQKQTLDLGVWDRIPAGTARHNLLRIKGNESMDIMNPDQPVVLDKDKVARFKANNIVRYILQHSSVDLNKLADLRYLFSQTDAEQFMQLIGYSVSGYGDLSFVSPESVKRADAAVEKALDEKLYTQAPAQPVGEDS